MIENDLRKIGSDGIGWDQIKKPRILSGVHHMLLIGNIGHVSNFSIFRVQSEFRSIRTNPLNRVPSKCGSI